MESTRKPASKEPGFAQKLDLSKVQIPQQLKGFNPLTILIGAAVGGAVMYMCDPVAGANRRSTLLARVKGLGSSTTTGVSSQFTSISSLVSGFISNWFKSASPSVNESTATADAAARSTTTSAFARKVAATDPDAYTATH